VATRSAMRSRVSVVGTDSGTTTRRAGTGPPPWRR
jgi:hypothetical protein